MYSFHVSLTQTDLRTDFHIIGVRYFERRYNRHLLKRTVAPIPCTIHIMLNTKIWSTIRKAFTSEVTELMCEMICGCTQLFVVTQ